MEQVITYSSELLDITEQLILFNNRLDLIYSSILFAIQFFIGFLVIYILYKALKIFI